MKIPESIIEKYKLTPINNHVGEAVIHNLMCFRSTLSGFEDILFMECDFMGKSCKDITFYNRAIRQDGIITPEFMNDMPVEIILQIVN